MVKLSNKYLSSKGHHTTHYISIHKSVFKGWHKLVLKYRDLGIVYGVLKKYIKLNFCVLVFTIKKNM